MKCSSCGNEAVYESRPTASFLCAGHFRESVEKRFRHELRKELTMGRKNITIAVAISGGKDSSVLLHLLHKTLSMRRDVKLVAFTVDEGIKGYRPPGIESARNLCLKLGVEHRVMSFREIHGTEMDEVVASAKSEGSPCAYCGPMRRDIMNRMSIDFHADYVALGINMDDHSQSVMMNVLRGDFGKMLRMAPHDHSVEGLVPRIVPMRKIYEKEAKLYAILEGIEHDDGWCPYSEGARRNRIRELLSQLEEETPGTKAAIGNFFDEMRNASPVSGKKLSSGKCEICGEPSSGKICQSCIRSGKMIKKI